jgi:hypothetical protein
MKSVAVLFSRKRSIYKKIPHLDVYDIDRDATNYSGGLPVIAHPPCRSWGQLSHMAFNVRPGEKELAYFALHCVRSNGGVLEHPKSSRLFKELPRPGQLDKFGGFVLGVNQSWFGHIGTKPTLLYICGILPADIPKVPFNLSYPLKSVEAMTTPQRERTPDQFAYWLIDLALKCGGAF